MSQRKHTRKWLPVAPLVEELGKRGYLDKSHNDGYDQLLTLKGLLSVAQLAAYYRAVKTGYLSDYHADNIANLLKLHPSEIWSNWPELMQQSEDTR